ncbi:undecaprenyl-diphosphate phosphatase [bacterium]|nr:undecaprenyl-diphosphate phosphatase [bacterium]
MPEQISALQALILGIVEGITEFLPISSTGHLLVTSQLLDVANSSGTFEIVIQLGAIIAVVIYYWKRLWAKLQLTLKDPKNFNLKDADNPYHFWINLFAAFFPAAFVGLLCHDFIDMLLEDRHMQAYAIAFTLFVGGIVLWWVDRNGDAPAGENGAEKVDIEKTDYKVSLKQAIWIGVAQCFALIPGVSRSGSTIVGGLLVGLNRAQATDFSFFLSIPTLGAATVYTLIKSYDKIMTVVGGGALSIGLIVSFIVAYLSIGWLLRYVSANNLKGFAIYRMIAGVFIAGWAYWFLA